MRKWWNKGLALAYGAILAFAARRAGGVWRTAAIRRIPRRVVTLTTIRALRRRQIAEEKQ